MSDKGGLNKKIVGNAPQKSNLMYAIPASLILLFILFVYFMNEDAYPAHLNLGEVRLVDSLNAGDFISERMHDYLIVGDAYFSSLVLHNPVEGRVIEDDCWSHNGTERFNVKALAGRELIMVKRIDSLSGGQAVNVSVDGRFVGVLKDPTVYPLGGHKWEYLVFTIPQEYVKENRLTVRLDYVAGDPDVNSFSYWFYVKADWWSRVLRNFLRAVFYAGTILLAVFVVHRLYYRGYVSVLLFVFAVIAPLLFSYYVLGAAPHDWDSISILFQARIFASGRLFYETPPQPEFFSQLFVVMEDGRWYSKYEPGHALILALGVLFGRPWAVNPILGALTMVVTYCIGSGIYDKKTGIYAALLGMTSPFFVWMSGSFFRHASTMFFLSLFVLFYIKAEKEDKRRYYVLSSVFLGLAFITRIGSTTAISLPIILYHLYRTAKNKRLWTTTLLMLGVTSIFIVALLGYNYALTGNPTQLTFTDWDSRDTIGFGDDKGIEPTYGTTGHDLSKGLQGIKDVIGELNRSFVNMHLLAIALILFIFSKKIRWDYVFTLSIVSLVFGTLFYFKIWPRYYYEIYFMVMLLVARSISDIEGEGSKLFTAVFVLSLINYYSTLKPDLYMYATRGVDKRVYTVIDESDLRNAVVFVEGDNFYRGVFSRNTPTLDTNIVYARYVAEKENQEFMEKYYPNRSCYTFKVENTRPTLKECET